MKKAFSVSIASPCDEKWDNFASVAGGRFCEQCNKTVIDFTKMSDAEIIDYFKDQPSATCGRFKPEQLKIYGYTNPVHVRPGYSLLKAGIVSMLLLLVGKTTFSQTRSNTPPTEIVSSPRDKNSDTLRVANQVLSGTVVEETTGDPLPGVNVWLPGSTVGTVTDADGKFQFPEKVHEGDIVVFTFIGLRTKEYRVPRESKVGTQISLSLCMDMDIMGGAKVESVYSEPTSRMNKLWAKVKSIF
jgi:hypothetical protein